MRGVLYARPIPSSTRRDYQLGSDLLASAKADSLRPAADPDQQRPETWVLRARYDLEVPDA
jgi:hypothetical protein